MDSVLTSVKKLLGITEEYEHFDQDLIIHINTALSVLNQVGVDNSITSIASEDDSWSDIIPVGTNLELIKTYIYLKVRLFFDPPSTAAVLDSLNSLVSEMEWRISSEIDCARRNL